MLRVLIVTAAYPPVTGGVPMHTSLLAEHLASAGVDVEVATQVVDGATAPTGSIPVRRFPGILSGFNTQSPRLWAWLAANSRRYDVVHVHNYHSLLLLPASLVARTALVLTPHYHGTGHSPARTRLHPLYRPLGRAAFRKAAAVICVSEPEADLVRAHFPVTGPITVIPNGVDAAAIAGAAPLERPRPYVLGVGRLERYKRFDLVIDAVASLPRPTELVIVGDGPERERLEHHAAERGAADRVTMLGRVDDPTLHGLLRGALLVTSASSEEAFGMVVAEGLAAGRRVVVSDIPAHRYVASLDPAASDAVVLVGDGDGAEGYRCAMEDALRLPPLAGPVPMPTWDDVARRTADVYALAAARFRRARASDAAKARSTTP